MGPRLVCKESPQISRQNKVLQRGAREGVGPLHKRLGGVTQQQNYSSVGADLLISPSYCAFFSVCLSQLTIGRVGGNREE